ncbi:MAG: Methanol dehydrogenase activator [Acidimicrobiales bacterium AG-410-I20]|nr:MAG: Methanol dehydrogenase activator [Acidimicrobiales bacterium AG-410-I20]
MNNSEKNFRKVSETVLHEGFVVTYSQAVFEGPQGEVLERDVVRHPGAVAVVALDKGDVILVNQYRPALEMNTLEIPAGKLDMPGETKTEAARRELIEETGYDCGEITLLLEFHNSAGFTDEITSIYLARELTPTEAKAVSVEEEYLTVIRLPVEEALRLLNDKKITDAKTVIGLLAIGFDSNNL